MAVDTLQSAFFSLRISTRIRVPFLSVLQTFKRGQRFARTVHNTIQLQSQSGEHPSDQHGKFVFFTVQAKVVVAPSNTSSSNRILKIMFERILHPPLII